ncbi:hypothetical protein TI03_01605 [Achromatium sp. WMS1]|nr:hypothetical protein TI03_01605 [Achromatium sp. WMS1]
MVLIRPFAGLRPITNYTSEVIAPPYDVINTQEAKELAVGRPWSFLRISRPEIDLPDDTDPYAPEVYAKAKANLEQMLTQGILQQDPQPCYYIYRLTMGEYSQTGLVGVASIAAYDTGRIKKHEFTRPAKEDDRVRQIEALNAQTGPVFLAYPSTIALDSLLMSSANGVPEVDIKRDGIRHELWVIQDSQLIKRLEQLCDSLSVLYVADGHHRSAAASRVAAIRRQNNPQHTGMESYNYFLAVTFPHNQLRIFDYNRVVKDLNGYAATEFLDKLKVDWQVHTSVGPVRPQQPAEFGLYMNKVWYRLNLDPQKIPDDPVKKLDVSLLSDYLLAPILGIVDQRRDSRIDFVGGIRGLNALERRVDDGEMSLALSLYPTQMEDLMVVADADKVMPPKSTWFEPKLVDGLVSHLLD